MDRNDLLYDGAVVLNRKASKWDVHTGIDRYSILDNNKKKKEISGRWALFNDGEEAVGGPNWSIQCSAPKDLIYVGIAAGRKVVKNKEISSDASQHQKGTTRLSIF